MALVAALLRIAMCFFTPMLLSACLCAAWIKIAKLLPWRKDVREDVPERHRKKVGTPTMGGLAFVIASSVVCVTFAIVISVNAQSSNGILLLAGTLVAFALLGAIDDACKGIKGKGIKARYKLLWQGACGLLIVAIMRYNFGLPTTFGAINLKDAYLLFGTLLIMASSNALNLTDGLDGLACGMSIISLAALMVSTIILGITTPYAVATIIGCLALLGSLIGFLPFNIHPAKVFMGDTGSLSLGAFMCVASMLSKIELIWLMSGTVFFIEMLTVVIQVISFKTTGRRVFPITPIHHAFEQLGWSEWGIVLSFWACSAICSGCAIALAMLLKLA